MNRQSATEDFNIASTILKGASENVNIESLSGTSYIVFSEALPPGLVFILDWSTNTVTVKENKSKSNHIMSKNPLPARLYFILAVAQ